MLIKKLYYFYSWGGGWQDQCGGLYGGVKLTTCKSELPLKLQINELKLPDNFKTVFNEHTILIYTGVTRLAKDLLLNVIRNWYVFSSEVCKTVNDLVGNSYDCAKAIEEGMCFIWLN